MKPFEKILVPVDFSDLSRQALDRAVELARPFAATLTLVHVFDSLVYALPEGYPGMTGEQVFLLRAELEKQLEAEKTRAQAAGAARTEATLLEGRVHSAICELASRAGFDLIVLGTHGRSGIARFVLGSVAERVIRMAPCPVLTVRRPNPSKS